MGKWRSPRRDWLAKLRALTWDHLDVVGDPEVIPPRPLCVHVWRSVRSAGDTKTRRSRRTIALPTRCVQILEKHCADQEQAGLWSEYGYVFCTREGTPLDAANVRRSFRAICEAAGLDDHTWTPRELRHSFVSLLSDAGVPIEDIARLVGHGSHRDGLSQAAAAGFDWRNAGNGRALPSVGK
jgi:integrase